MLLSGFKEEPQISQRTTLLVGATDQTAGVAVTIPLTLLRIGPDVIAVAASAEVAETRLPPAASKIAAATDTSFLSEFELVIKTSKQYPD